MLIAFSGPQSSGKSTLLEECRLFYANQFSYEREIARTVQQMGGKINEEGDNIGQLLIINTHLTNSLKQNTIVDRCIVDALAYSEYSFARGGISKWVMDYCDEIYHLCIKKYDVIFYTSPDIPLKIDGVRSTNLDFRKEISEIFEDILGDYFNSGQAVRLTGTVAERMERVKQEIEARR
jgi:nicotinamide riboside kinase